MSLRTRLLLAFSYLTFLLIVTASIGALGFNRLSEQFDRALLEIKVINEQQKQAINALQGASESDLAQLLQTLTAQSEAKTTQMTETNLLLDEAVQSYGMSLGVVVVLALISMTIISLKLQKDFLGRLLKLKKFGEALSDGATHLRLFLTSNDELSLIARQLNAILDKWVYLDATARGRMNELRRLVLALLQHHGQPAAVFSNSGDIVVTTIDDINQEIIASISHFVDEVASRSEVATGKALRHSVQNRHFTFERLFYRKQLIAGWLVVEAKHSS